MSAPVKPAVQICPLVQLPRLGAFRLATDLCTTNQKCCGTTTSPGSSETQPPGAGSGLSPKPNARRRTRVISPFCRPPEKRQGEMPTCVVTIFCVFAIRDIQRGDEGVEWSRDYSESRCKRRATFISVTQRGHLGQVQRAFHVHTAERLYNVHCKYSPCSTRWALAARAGHVCVSSTRHVNSAVNRKHTRGTILILPTPLR